MEEGLSTSLLRPRAVTWGLPGPSPWPCWENWQMTTNMAAAVDRQRLSRPPGGGVCSTLHSCTQAAAAAGPLQHSPPFSSPSKQLGQLGLQSPPSISLACTEGQLAGSYCSLLGQGGPAGPTLGTTGFSSSQACSVPQHSCKALHTGQLLYCNC